jgi:hypothetical protein
MIKKKTINKLDMHVFYMLEYEDERGGNTLTGLLQLEADAINHVMIQQKKDESSMLSLIASCFTDRRASIQRQ